MEKTEWFLPPLTPERVGYYEIQWFDCGWSYEWKVWWDGAIWRNEREGWALLGQNQTWRGLAEEAALTSRVDHIDDAGYVHWKVTK